MCKKKLLTIAIPTYNRAQYLYVSLSRIFEQIKGLQDYVEIIVSDNCSQDNTKAIVEDYISKGLNIEFIRNSENIGMDGNFVQCFKKAKGEYVWILGDDDYLLNGTIEFIVRIIRKGDYGLIHLKIGKTQVVPYVVYRDYKKFYSEISYWITYISSNIVRTKYVQMIDFNKYMGSYFTLIPLYMKALSTHETNVMVYTKVFEEGAAFESNGGYNFFEVFVKNYLNIVKESVSQKTIPYWRYELEKYRVYRCYLYPSIYNLLVYRKNKHNYDTSGAFKFLGQKYWYEPYFLPSLILFVIRRLLIRK